MTRMPKMRRPVTGAKLCPIDDVMPVCYPCRIVSLYVIPILLRKYYLHIAGCQAFSPPVFVRFP